MTRNTKPKRKSLPSSPPKPSSPVSESLASSSPPKARSVNSVRRSFKNCPVCNAMLVNRNGSLARHVERHAKLAKIEAMNFEINLPRLETPDFDVKLAQKMWQSVPARRRATGGVFLDGPLAGEGFFEGMPNVFLPNGRVKPKWAWIKKDLDARVGRGPLRALKNANANAGSVLDSDEYMEI
ncbi:hypothetical protein H9Q69_005908 [Fusarium xylarioides]|uniref:Uncharacterized protein n=1 Tax=Fusarium xylarioides TaxID=221167 RepID=A0A9P7LEH4_9HYPO|nr:hypothetical protein H9Q70_012948 [Fusarium xylarioides]KAG5765019.1 hypothetical protein H9Q72_006907 [Fusarium xylarioides]KAG5776700.1 hypothetical protein H9Q73_009633 [Fusarium xylarioides]KAG5795014.1 hypothetical protein H9Q69_005908 [Fusarium xylarioides]KAG5804177.1 hypothetical protein H9Q71_011242 [Fusarium xylarioides]